MPATPTVPASGDSVIAAGQVLARRVVIIRGKDPANQLTAFGTGSPSGVDVYQAEIRNLTNVMVANLARISVSVFHYGQYNDGTDTYRARNWLEWRVVGLAPDADLPVFNGIVAADYVPLTAPLLTRPNLPVSCFADVGGLSQVAVEFRVNADIADAADQGHDRLVVTIAAAQ